MIGLGGAGRDRESGELAVGILVGKGGNLGTKSLLLLLGVKGILGGCKMCGFEM